jgi:hypothetical protein
MAVYYQSVRLGDKPLKTRGYWFYFIAETLRLCNILSDERMDVSFTIASGPRQRSHSQVRIPRESWSHFTVSHSRLPQPGAPGPRIYIPQEKGGPVIPPDTGFPFRRFLRPAGRRCSKSKWHHIILQIHVLYLCHIAKLLVENIVLKNLCSFMPERSLDSSVGIVTDYGLDDREVGVRVPEGSKVFSSPNCPDQLWGSPNLISNGYQGLFPGVKAAGAWNWQPTSQLVPRSTQCGSIHPLPHTPSWR